MMVIFVIFGCVVLLVVLNAVGVSMNGPRIPVPDTPQESFTIGSGPRLSYMILGDSTTVSHGGEYDEGFVVATAQHLSEKYTVTYQNFGVSGAKTADVLRDQLVRSEGVTPDVVLVSITANDLMKYTPIRKIRRDMLACLDNVHARNEDVRVVMTGCPSMGDVLRLFGPLRWYARHQTGRINTMLLSVCKEYGAEFAYIARDTAPIFNANPRLFSSDKFHPNTEGYKVWVPFLNAALDRVLQKS